MDRAFLTYYEEELGHIRSLAGEFAAMHPTVARNLSLEAVPCPDPYVERLLEGVAYLAARTRLKLDIEGARHVRRLLDALYPDLAAPAPAMGMATLVPGPQVQGMPAGHVVPRGSRLVAGLREGLTTRAVYTTAQNVTFWPLEIVGAEYLQDVGALLAAGLSDRQVEAGEAGILLTLRRTGTGRLGELDLDQLDLHLGSRGGLLFDAIHGGRPRAFARPRDAPSPFLETGRPGLVGIADEEGLLPRVRPAFEGYRLLREYFLMPERFHFIRLDGLRPAVAATGKEPLEIVIVLEHGANAISDLRRRDFGLFATPIVNLFERECNIVDLDPRASAHVVHADRTRPRDFEIYRLLRVEDADSDGPEAQVLSLHAAAHAAESRYVYTVDRRTRRPGEDELRRGQTRTSHVGDELFISVARRHDEPGPALRRLDIRALCTNRDLPLLDDAPRLTPEGGDPIARVELASTLRSPRAALSAALRIGSAGEASSDQSWRWIAQLSLNHLSLAEEGKGSEPLRALLELYADRGDPALARHARAVRRVGARRVIERLPHGGPICFAHGTEITLDIDDAVLTGSSMLLLSALLAQLFARHAAVNAFVRTRARLLRHDLEVTWPSSPGIRPPI